jgi:hypothetical protein
LGRIDNPIKDFLQEYKELADSYRLTSRQKVETVIRYVAQSQRDIWKSLEGFINRDWDDLCRDLRDEYVDPTPQGRYSKQKLQDYTNKRARRPIEDEEDMLKYYRIFNRLSKSLLDSDRITTGEWNTAFWRGFHPDDRKALHERLIAKKPDMPRGRAFDYKDVLSIARAIFSGDDDFYLQEQPSRRHKSDHARERRTERPERDPRESDRDEYAPRRNRSREPPSFEGPESEDEEDLYPGEDGYKRPKQKTRYASPRVETKTVRFKSLFRSEEDRELDELIRHLHSLSVRDPEYASLYALSSCRFPDIVSTLPKPEYRPGPAMAAYSFQAAPAPTTPSAPQPWSARAPPPSAQQPWSAQAPPVPSSALPPVIADSAASFFRPRPSTCNFCTLAGHQVRDCSMAKEYVNTGRATIVGNCIHLPNHQPVPYDGSR